MQISERKRGVLYAVIRDFISTAAPVGSIQIAGRKNIQLSSATVRSVMAELEELGFLRRTHASSGRIPTDTAYRFYVNELIQLQNLTAAERKAIRDEVESGTKDMTDILRHACRLISDKANQPSLGLAPALSRRSLKHIQFIRLRGRLVLAILVSSTGIVENKILELDRSLTQRELDRMHNYLNDLLSGLTISQVRQEVFREIKRAKNQYDDLLNQALLLGERVFLDVTPDVHIEGQSHLASDPEFANLEKMQQILRTLEEKTLIIRLVDESLHSPGVKIFIGEEIHAPEVNGLTLVTSAYSDADGNRGLLGVIGPTRLDYARIIPLVDFTAQIVTKVLSEKDE